MLGGLTVWIFGLEGTGLWGDERFWGTAFVMVAVTLTMIQSYGALERTQTIIVGILLICILLATFAAKPDWLAALWGMLVPSLPVYPAWVFSKYPAVGVRSPWIELGTYLGAIGGGTQDYFGYIGMLREKAWGLMGRQVDGGKKGIEIAPDEENIQRGKLWLKAPLSDTGGSFFCVVFFTIAFMILGAILLHPKEIVPAGMGLLSVQAEFLTLLHPLLLYLYQGGVFIAFIGTIIGAYELYVRTTHECLRPIVKKVREASVSQLRPWVVAYCAVGGVGIMWLGGNPVTIVTPAAIFGGVLTCGLWCLLMVWTDRVFLPKALQMGPVLLVLNVLSGLLLTGWGIVSAVIFIDGFF